MPVVEFRMLGGEVDVGIRAGEPHRKPFLAIAAIPAAHYPMGDLVRHIVVKPAAALRKEIGLAGPDLLSELSQRCLARSFSRIDAALRHLPPRESLRHPNPVADEHEAVGAEQHDPDPGPIIRELARSVASNHLSTRN